MFFGSSYIKAFISAASVAVLGIYGCTTDEKFPDIETNFAGPVDLVSVGSYGFVLNSDFDRKYNTGSIVTIDPSQESGSEKLRSHLVPRMGRSIYSSGQLMIATFDRVELDSMGSVEIYSVSNDGVLTTSYKQDLDCSPIAAVISSSQSWATVTCLNGGVYIAPLNTASLDTTTFRLVRDYDYARRALYIYESGSEAFLLAFPTDFGQQTSGDFGGSDNLKYIMPSEDTQGTDTEGQITEEGSNEVPDDFESTAARIRQYGARYPYQLAILNLTESQANDFVFKGMASPSEAEETTVLSSNNKTVYTYANNELKFIYFNLSTKGDEPNENSGTVVADLDETKNFYRTNFWEVKPSDTPEKFYLSHRGINESDDSNNILEFNILNGEVFAGPTASTPAPFSNRFSGMFNVERVFGSSAIAKSGYPGDFEIRTIGGTSFAFVNQFRDEAYWDASSRLYAIDSTNLSLTEESVQRWQGGDFNQSAHELSLVGSDTSGDPVYLISCSFYGDSVLVFPIDKSNGIDVSADPTVIY